MIDISKFSSKPFVAWIVLGLAAIVFLVTLIIFIKRGIIKDLFGFIYIGGLVCGIIFALPLLKNLLGGLGFIPETVWKFSKEQIVSVISWILLLLVWFILIKILNACFKKVFKYEKKISRFFGFLLGLPFAIVLTFASLQILTTPYILKGAEQTKTSNQIMSLVYEKGVKTGEAILENSGVPGSIEDIIILSRVDNIKDPVFSIYKESFNNIENFKLDNASYVATINSDETATQSVKDFNNVIESCGAFSGKVAINLLPDVEAYINALDGRSFHIGTQKARFVTNLTNIGASEELLAKVSTIFAE